MPTYEATNRFRSDLAGLTESERKRFHHAVAEFVEDLRGDRFRKGLRVKRVQGTRDVWEMTFAPDGRATWQYGEERQEGEPHVIWRRIGTHEIFRDP